jgi:hypothetical protein
VQDALGNVAEFVSDELSCEAPSSLGTNKCKGIISPADPSNLDIVDMIFDSTVGLGIGPYTSGTNYIKKVSLNILDTVSNYKFFSLPLGWPLGSNDGGGITASIFTQSESFHAFDQLQIMRNANNAAAAETANMRSRVITVGGSAAGVGFIGYHELGFTAPLPTAAYNPGRWSTEAVGQRNQRSPFVGARCVLPAD